MKARLVLLAALIVSGILLAARAIVGPLPPVNSPMNVEGIFALAFLALLLTRDSQSTLPAPVLSEPLLATALATIVVAAFAFDLNFPFLADSYLHIWNARHADPAALWAHLTSPEFDRFFRPAVYYSFAIDALWAGLSPTAWRAANLAIHVANVLLVYWLCREVNLSRPGAFIGALIFGLHGSRPEAVTWVAARFDLMAAMFSLAALIALLRRARWWITCSLLAVALMSKESAYVVPILGVLLLRYKGLARRQAVPLFITAAITLVYRLCLLHGIGGYRDAATGAPTIFQFGLFATLKAMLPRFWAVLLFPLNWTGGLDPTTAFFLAASLAALVYLAIRGADRKKLLLGIAFATVCSLPVHQFLSIGPDLEKSRVVYLASIGLAILCAALFEHLDAKAFVCAAALLAFQWSALHNNLRHWRHVGELAGRTCAGQSGLAAIDPPVQQNVVDGVYFLHTGFPECVKLFEERQLRNNKP